MSDLEVDKALICYYEVMDTEVEFRNINYRLATKYIAIGLTETLSSLQYPSKTNNQEWNQAWYNFWDQ